MLKFIELSKENKSPATSFDTTYKNVDTLSDAGVLLNNNTVVVDFDAHNEEEINALSKIVNIILNKYPTFNVKTTRGYHLYYKKPKTLTIKAWTGTTTVGGFKVDYKTGTKAYAVVKKNDTIRDMTLSLNELNFDDLVELPQELYPVIKNKNTLLQLGDGDGRNAELFKHLMCVKEKYDIDLKVLSKFINDNVFKDKFKPKELEELIKSVTARESGNGSYNGEANDIISLSKFLLKEVDVQLYNGKLYFYDGTQYNSDNRLLLQVATNYLDTLKRNQDNELQHQLYKRVKQNNTDIKKFHISINNGIIKNGEFIPINNAGFTPFVLNVTYNAEAYDVNVDKFLNEISCNRVEIRQTLEEILGHILMIDKFPAHVFFLKGNGKNGKSTFLEMINEFVGSMGTTLGLESFNDGTSVSMLNGKLVNCSDETDDVYIEKCKGYKSLASGNTITVRPIYSQPVMVKNTATLLLNANKMPQFKDKTGGFFRRLKIIPFDYDVSNKKRVANLLDLLSTDNAKSYILNLALKGLDRIVENGYTMSDNKYIDSEIEDYILETDTVAGYLQEYKDITGNQTDLIYSQYEIYCESCGNNALNKSNFTKRLKDFGYNTQSRKNKKGISVRCYISTNL